MQKDSGFIRTLTVQNILAQRQASGSISAAGAAQKFRATYFLLKQFLHTVNPCCNQPLHRTLHRVAYYGGNTQSFRDILARLGVLNSAEDARVGRIYDGMQSNEAQREWFKTQLKAGKFFMFVDDNLDWRGQASRIHMFKNSANDKGIHILMRQCNLLNAPEFASEAELAEWMANCDRNWRLIREITYEEVVDHVGIEAAAAATHVELQLARAHVSAYDSPAAAELVVHFMNLQAKLPLDEEGALATQSNVESARPRTRVYSLDETTKKLGKNCLGAPR